MVTLMGRPTFCQPTRLHFLYRGPGRLVFLFSQGRVMLTCFTTAQVLPAMWKMKDIHWVRFHSFRNLALSSQSQGSCCKYEMRAWGLARKWLDFMGELHGGPWERQQHLLLPTYLSKKHLLHGRAQSTGRTLPPPSPRLLLLPCMALRPRSLTARQTWWNMPVSFTQLPPVCGGQFQVTESVWGSFSSFGVAPSPHLCSVENAL